MQTLNSITSQATPVVFKDKIPATPIAIQAPAPDLLQTVDPSRVKTTLERPLNLVSRTGQTIGTIQLEVFLRNLYKCLQNAKMEPHHFDVAGGGVAYLIGSDTAK